MSPFYENRKALPPSRLGVDSLWYTRNMFGLL
jgi:hypothetical protein